uniref:Uncharacterized protein n=1 Tax=Arundo donax TaxID=35708 RepID=A0A0A8YC97_ARUDO
MKNNNLCMEPWGLNIGIFFCGNTVLLLFYVVL